ncbi:uncharacterized protein HMPREF1541_06020 [Cyphellophora europaea CBS 101466]|uniref:Uncharacterized protein n=1 Tax=Cyphellophora europaea (strain CBS 101466) TaxID=1220924 RepID=W2RVR3_CYPE1|nr:uncharacterized protein HMPREF1541_06020 [Cyphellophora europaea CBS 101466]ETN39794.1 hypothetical protein HMPREF1541_06020 [Cyphellophora europaea CBS 101466]
MAFQAPTGATARRILHTPLQDSTLISTARPQLEESQEWVLFSPSQIGSSTERSSRTAGLSRTSGLASLQLAGRSQLESEALDEDLTEDGELDTLDEGLHAFQEPLYPSHTQHSQGAVLPTHDGLGGFSASSPPVLEQLWQHEHYNPKRKHQGHHRRPSSVQRRFDTVEELEAQANEEKRVRIEKWRLDQSQAMLEEVERETRRQVRRQSVQQGVSVSDTQDLLGSTPKQSDYLRPSQRAEAECENEPFWRRLTRKFIRDIIGIDEPLLSVILGESLPEEALEPKPAPLPTIPESTSAELGSSLDDAWRDRLLHRIARELGVCVHAISPHPGAFTSYTDTSALPASSQTHDYAGLPVTAVPIPETRQSANPPSSQALFSSALTPNFPPTLHSPRHAASWGFDDTAPGTSLQQGPTASTSSSHLSSDTLDLQREREYWERELDVRMVFRFLKERITGSSPTAPPQQHQHNKNSGGASGYGTSPEEIGKRTAIIRQHHPLVARAHVRPAASATTPRSPIRSRRESQVSLTRLGAQAGVAARRPGSSCASESMQSGRSLSRRRSASGAGSANYWDLGGSVGSGSVLASGGLWGEA